MFENYADIFNKRGNFYNRASLQYPNARETERQLLLERLELNNARYLCDAPAGGGYLVDGIPHEQLKHCKILCVDPSAIFSEGVTGRYPCKVAPLQHLPLDDEEVDRVGSLAGIHHMTTADKLAFFKEVARVLQPGGRFVVADVQQGSATGLFLNEAVDRLTETGHKGLFLEPGQASEMIEGVGLQLVEEKHIHFTWDFSNASAMVVYCKALFGLTRGSAQEVEAELRQFLDVSTSENGTHLAWSLVYATAHKP